MTEQEEKDYRALLEDELPSRSYKIGEGPWVAYTGKAGYINYMVQLKKLIPKVYGKPKGPFFKGDKPVITEAKLKEALDKIMDEPQFKNAFNPPYTT